MKAIRTSPLFWLGVVLRLLALPFFGSTYLRDLFVPFLDQAVLHPTSNPWSHFPPNYFPYGSVLYLAEFVPRWVAYELFGQAALGTTWLGVALVKLPMLLFDVLALFTLSRLAWRRRSQVLLYYWFNPVLFYIIYLHGQLDVAAIALCLVSIHCMVRRKPELSAVAMALATLCKFTVVLVIPLMLAFLWKRNFLEYALRKMVAWAGIFVGICAVGFLPLIFSKTLAFATGGSPQALRLFALQITLGDNHALYIGLGLLLGLLGRLLASSRISEEGLVYGCGCLLGTLVLVTDAMPGWYFWVYPFIALFYANYVTVPRLLYWASCVFYLLHFGSAHLGVPLPEHYDSITLTLLQTSLASLLVACWVLVVRREAPINGFSRPKVIGISGDSGAGKDTLSRLLCELFEVEHTLVVEGDDYHKWARGNENWRTTTHLNPNANRLGKLASDAGDLLSGKLAFQPHYNHDTGQFTAPREIRPNRTIIIQGLHTLYLRSMRESFDLKVFLDPDERVRLAWKISRDVGERGKDLNAVLESLRQRESDAELHVRPQREIADWIIEYFPLTDVTDRKSVV